MLDAEAVANGAAAPKFKRADYERAMLDLAGSTVEFAWLCATNDPRMSALYAAARLADLWEGCADDPCLTWTLLGHLLRQQRQDGESAKETLERLIQTDAMVRDGYQLCCQEAKK